MDSVDHIEDLIVRNSEGFFDEKDIREDLHVTIRIARDFYDFLVKYGENPRAGEAAYVSDTIRSGMDQFFGLAQICRVINTEDSTWIFDPHLHWDFPALRQRFLQDFERLSHCVDTYAPRNLALLLALAHLELVFLAQNFPSALFRDLGE